MIRIYTINLLIYVRRAQLELPDIHEKVNTFFAICGKTGIQETQIMQNFAVYEVSIKRLIEHIFAIAKQDIARIKDMGFNVIAIKPITEIGTDVYEALVIEDANPKDQQKHYWVGSSIYAPNFHFYTKDDVSNGERTYYLLNLLNPRITLSNIGQAGQVINELLLKYMHSYIHTIISYDMHAMWDFVGKHIAKTSKHCDLFRTQGWLSPIEDEKYHDVFCLAYTDYLCEQKNRDIFNAVHKPFIDYHLREFDYTGVRIDCLSRCKPYILRITQYIKSRLQFKGVSEPIIFAEFNLDREVNLYHMATTHPIINFLLSMHMNGNKVRLFTHFSTLSHLTPTLNYTDYDSKERPSFPAYFTDIDVKNHLFPRAKPVNLPSSHDGAPLYMVCRRNFEDMIIKILHTMITGSFGFVHGDEGAVIINNRQPSALYIGGEKNTSPKPLISTMQYRYEASRCIEEIDQRHQDLASHIEILIKIIWDYVKKLEHLRSPAFVYEIASYKKLLLIIGIGTETFQGIPYIAINPRDLLTESGKLKVLQYKTIAFPQDPTFEFENKITGYRDYVGFVQHGDQKPDNMGGSVERIARCQGTASSTDVSLLSLPFDYQEKIIQHMLLEEALDFTPMFKRVHLLESSSVANVELGSLPRVCDDPDQVSKKDSVKLITKL